MAFMIRLHAAGWRPLNGNPPGLGVATVQVTIVSIGRL